MITVVGEALVDLVVAADGTITADTGRRAVQRGRACARLGMPVSLVAAVSTDRFGQRLMADLAADGVDHRAGPAVGLPDHPGRGRARPRRARRRTGSTSTERAPSRWSERRCLGDPERWWPEGSDSPSSRWRPRRTSSRPASRTWPTLIRRRRLSWSPHNSSRELTRALLLTAWCRWTRRSSHPGLADPVLVNEGRSSTRSALVETSPPASSVRPDERTDRRRPRRPRRPRRRSKQPHQVAVIVLGRRAPIHRTGASCPEDWSP